MITLFTLYNILENKYDYNEEFEGYYLGHTNNKVMFGYYYPLNLTSFLASSLIHHNNIKKIINNITSHRIVSYKDIDIIEKNNVYELYYKMWIKNKNKKIQLLRYTYTVSEQYKNDLSGANLLLIRDVKILK
jgi:hypothetical protein